MPRYRHDGEALIVTCGKRTGCVVFALGSLVKCTSLYFAGANCDSCYSAHFFAI